MGANSGGGEGVMEGEREKEAKWIGVTGHRGTCMCIWQRERSGRIYGWRQRWILESEGLLNKGVMWELMDGERTEGWRREKSKRGKD